MAKAPKGELMTLFIRNVPTVLWRDLKVRAAEESKTLQDLCIELLEKSVKERK